MKKLLSFIWKFLLAIVILVVVAVLGFKVFDLIKHSDFYSRSKVAFKTPGANDNFVQQGFDYIPHQEKFLVTGYMSDDTASRVYVLDKEGTVLSYTELKKEDGSDYCGHTGGIAHYNNYVYITGATGLDVFSYDDILAGKATTNQLGSIKTHNNPAHCYIADGYILVGSFFIEEDYETPERERITTPAGDDNTSIITAFKIDGSFDFAVNPKLRAVISTRRCVQGMCITDDGKIVLSTSYGLSTSQLFVYDIEKITREDGFDFDEFYDIQLYYLDSASLVEVIKAPPMAEELVYLDGKIYVMNESACNKYIFGKITTGYNVYAYDYKNR